MKTKTTAAQLGKWDRRFLDLAKVISQYSKDPSTKCGAILTDAEHRIISTGYNGFPRDVLDLPERLENRDTKYPIILHAEHNAVLFARRDLTGATLYTWPLQPCPHCCAVAIQCGITRIVCPQVTDAERLARINYSLAERILGEAGINLVVISTLEAVNG